MTLAVAVPSPKAHPGSPRLVGNTQPRICPPRPVRSAIVEFQQTAADMGIDLMPWQKVAGRYLMARNADGTRPYREVAIVVARQNGKTTLMKPFIIHALRAGKRIMHIAQTRELPRHMFGVIADALAGEPDLFPKRRGKVIWPRYGAGQEEIALLNGGTYRLAASRTGGARGWSNDVVIIDELREMDSFDIINAAEPTLMMSPDPVMVYLSNAGTEKSVVLNSVRDRAKDDPGLAYLEWSADPERAHGDRKAWAQANPALGQHPSVLPYLEAAFTRHRLANSLPTFQTEHLCQWVDTELPKVVSDVAWERARGVVGEPVRPSLGLAQDPGGRRASAAMAWMKDDKVHGYLLADVDGYPVDLEAAAEKVLPPARKLGVGKRIAFDPWTDREFARHFKDAKPMQGADWEAACASFSRTLDADELVVEDPDGRLTLDMAGTVRRSTAHGWIAVRASDERPNTGALALIRAVYLATMPAPSAPRVW